MSAQTQERQEQSSDGRGPEGDDRERGPRKRWFVIAAVVAALALIIIFGVPWLRYSLSHEGTDDAYVSADIVQVTSKIAERIDDIPVATNQYVRRGQLLVVLDDRDEMAKLAQARAQYDLALAEQRTNVQQGQGGVSQASAGVAQAQAQVGVAAANLPAAQENYDKALADLARTQSLVSTGDVPAEQLDSARATAAAAQAQLNSTQRQIGAANAAVDAARGGVTTARGRLAQAADASQVESARAQLELAMTNLHSTHIYAPIDGYVGEKSAEIGQTVAAGQKIMTLVPAKGIYITANYKETQIGKMRVGQPVDIHVDAYPGVTFHGRVVSFNPASENTYALVPSQSSTGNFVKVTQRVPVRISIDDARADMPLRPGMSVETYVKVK
ncbi:MAG: HlyD family secretion protein [Candidatus Tyrphobacter sp.]